MKTTIYIRKRVTIESDNFVATRFRSTDGEFEIEVRDKNRHLVYQFCKDSYETDAKELASLLEKIADNTCKITDQ